LESVRRSNEWVLRRIELASHSTTAITDAMYHDTKATNGRSSPMRNIRYRG
jgi:hypothetical protein